MAVVHIYMARGSGKTRRNKATLRKQIGEFGYFSPGIQLTLYNEITDAPNCSKAGYCGV